MAKQEPGKILVFDIETSDFKANFGYMLMWCAKFIGEDEVHYARIDDTKGFGKTPESMINDYDIVMALRDLVDEADAVVYHYGDRFDLRFLNTRCLEHGELPPGKVTSIDTWKIARNNLAMTSNRLGTLAESYGGDHQKGGLSKLQWKLAVHGCKDTLDAMLDYCRDDVLATEAVYLTLRPLIWNHPITHGVPGTRTCPACGHENSHGNGTRRTKHFLVHRRRCPQCGTGFESHREKIKA